MKKNSVVIAMTTLFLIAGMPAGAVDSWVPPSSPPEAGELVQSVYPNSQTLPSPHSATSTLGTTIVTWFGHESEACAWNANEQLGPSSGFSTNPPSCGVLYRLFDSSGAPLTEVKRIQSDTAATYYYGAPEAQWNPKDNEWVISWASYGNARGLTVPVDQAGFYLARISSVGEVIGAIRSVTSDWIDGQAADDPTTPDIDERAVRIKSGNVSNSPLVWIESRESWLAIIYTLRYTPTNSIERLIAYLELDSTLVPRGKPVIFSRVEQKPHGAVAAYSPASDAVLTVYRSAAGKNFVGRVLSLQSNSVSVSSELDVVSGDASLREVTPGLAYVADQDKFIFSYGREVSGIQGLWVKKMKISAGNSSISREEPVEVFSSAYDGQRSWVAFDENSGDLKIAQTLVDYTPNPDYSMAVIISLSSQTLSQTSPTIRIGESQDSPVEPIRAASRITLNGSGGGISYAYMSWVDKVWGDSPTVRFGVLSAPVNQNDPGEQVSATPYTGPILQAPGTSKPVAPGAKVVIPGSNLTGVSKATIDGKDASVKVNSAGELELTVPTGLVAGTYDLVITSDSGVLTVQDGIRVSGAAVVAESLLKSSTKLKADNTVKVYVFEVVGSGKVQIKLNGKEVAWIKTTNPEDSKLTNGYLVRTLELSAGKNVIEVLVDGKRVDRKVYSN